VSHTVFERGRKPVRGERARSKEGLWVLGPRRVVGRLREGRNSDSQSDGNAEGWGAARARGKLKSTGMAYPAFVRSGEEGKAWR